MRTKKSAIKEVYITRTVKFTSVKYVSVNLEEKKVEEWEYELVGEYSEKEAKAALEEIGLLVAAVASIETYERKVAMRLIDFVRFGTVEE